VCVLKTKLLFSLYLKTNYENNYCAVNSAKFTNNCVKPHLNICAVNSAKITNNCVKPHLNILIFNLSRLCVLKKKLLFSLYLKTNYENNYCAVNSANFTNNCVKPHLNILLFNLSRFSIIVWLFLFCDSFLICLSYQAWFFNHHYYWIR